MNVIKFPRLSPYDMTHASLAAFNRRIQLELGDVHAGNVSFKDTNSKRYRQKYNRIRREYILLLPKGTKL